MGETAMAASPDMKWYVVHTYSGFENKAKKSLEDKIKLEGLQEFFGDILVPTEQVVEMRDGQKRTTRSKDARDSIWRSTISRLAISATDRSLKPSNRYVSPSRSAISWFLVSTLPTMLRVISS